MLIDMSGRLTVFYGFPNMLSVRMTLSFDVLNARNASTYVPLGIDHALWSRPVVEHVTEPHFPYGTGREYLFFHLAVIVSRSRSDC